MLQARRWLKGPWVPPHLGKAPYLWLLSLNFFLWKYFYIQPTLLELGMLALSITVFVPMYFASYWLRNRRAVALLLATVALGFAWAPFNFGACTFFIFACSMCAALEQPRHAYFGIGMILGGAALVSLAVELPLTFLLPALAVGAPVGIASVMDARVRRSGQQLLRKQEEVEHLARIAERERISRDLHDLLGHTLSLIAIKAELAGRLLERDAAATAKEIKDIETTARHALAEVRSAVTGFRQSGFAQELAQARAALAAAGVELDADVHSFPMPATVENVLALSLREAVTNILRHARATRCQVSVRQGGGQVVCHISDDGSAPVDRDALASGNGLRGMRERVMAAGGRLALEAGPGGPAGGLALELHLPMGAVA
ncbi:two-component system, NarL family, sensor histidine kinase DesK [Duganella sp. CF458]|uniref:sensor histidine kinase n=1 Tax=Duganella sp. CF458 TaxID=1884368 RepID=UPI0008EAAAE4|nr:sensor histidine kinase [Duganella sp. CF458]SFF53819.1 two-component system, NarL family, sensor histidine kinase DesK [Duganella sp. CF458]